MTRKTTPRHPSKLALAAVLATGMAASPIALNSALAQSSTPAATPESSSGAADEFVDGGAGSSRDVHTNAYRILGTTEAEAISERVGTTANTDSGPFREYQHEVESNNLEGAAKSLALVSNRPITQALVNELNTTLGLETSLTSEQLAERAAELQDPNDITMGMLVTDTAYGDMRKLNTKTPSLPFERRRSPRAPPFFYLRRRADIPDLPRTDPILNRRLMPECQSV